MKPFLPFALKLNNFVRFHIWRHSLQDAEMELGSVHARAAIDFRRAP